MKKSEINKLRSGLVAYVNSFEAKKDLVGVCEAIAYLMLDVALSAANKSGHKYTRADIQAIIDDHRKDPKLYSAMVLQACAMLGWADSEDLLREIENLAEK